MDILILAPIGATCALLFAAYLALRLQKNEEGTDIMKEISQFIRKGANAYLKRQYTVVCMVFAGMFVILMAMAFAGHLSIFVPFAFITGGFFSALAGFIGMKVATRANSRTAHACRSSLNSGLRVSFNSGAVMGMAVVGLGLLDLSFWYYFLDWFYTGTGAGREALMEIAANKRLDLEAARILTITSAMLTFGMGASIMALFARVGGGIFTKAADVGADLVGKVEAGIPEDDPRNPAVIADNVGDNVGDVAGMGADLYESYVVSIVATAALAVSAGLGVHGVSVPLVMAAIGVLSSILGTFLVRTKESDNQSKLLWALRYGVYGSSFLIAVFAFFLVRYVLGPDYMGVYFSILIGLAAGNAIGFITEFFTSDAYKPTKRLAESSQTGAATIIIGGLSLGLLSTGLPVLVVGSSVIASFFITGFSGGAVAGSIEFINQGMYGVGIAAVGMLSTLGITLATDAYGPIADNAGGIAQMSNLPDEVRKRTDMLDSLGNTTAATGKGYAIGSAALTSLALIAAYTEEIRILDENFVFNLSIVNPPVLIGLFVGAMVVFVFSALTIRAVNNAAQGIVIEVRRQFREIIGLMEGTAKADYAKCVDICTRSAQREMILPSLLAVAAPLLVGFFLGVNGVTGMLAGALVAGFTMAIMMANAGGAWDNAKKYIESGNLGGKGSDNHKAAVVGDTVGDPLKDTSGPSINNFIKLLAMVSIVFASLIMSISLM